MLFTRFSVSIIAAILAAVSIAHADDDPRHERHEAMEEVGDAAKPLGQMLKGEREYDTDQLMASLQVFAKVSEQFGELFPPGSETGMGTEAAPAIWEDREGFDAAMKKWQEATAAAIEAAPATLDEAKGTVGPVFGTCKNCHDTYRVEED